MGGEDETPAVTLPPSLRFLRFLNEPESDTKSTDRFELDERDVIWASQLSSDPQSDSESEPEPEPAINVNHSPGPGSGLSAIFSDDVRPIRSVTGRIRSSPGTMAKSAPVNVPVWHRRERTTTRFEAALDAEEEEEEERDDDVEEEEMVPPHVMAASSHVMNFSVFEGVGRTLKGRDLRSVRNAVFQKTGFLD